MVILNVKNPENPKSVPGSVNYKPNGNALRVAVEGNRAYLADNKKKVWIVDVTNRKKPKELGYFDAKANVKDLVV